MRDPGASSVGASFEPRRSEPRSGKFQRQVQMDVFCNCGAEYSADAWLGLPLLGRVVAADDDDDDGEIDRRPIEVRQCPRCHGRLVARERR